MKRGRKLKVDVAKLLVELGVEARKSGNEWRGHCPDPRHQAIAGSSTALKSGPGTWNINVDGFHHADGLPVHLQDSWVILDGSIATRLLFNLQDQVPSHWHRIAKIQAPGRNLPGRDDPAIYWTGPSAIDR